MKRYTATLRAPADFGLAIREARLTRGLTQEQLAEELDVPQSTVSELESGKSTIFLRRLLSAAQATGITLSATWEEGNASGS